MESNYTNRFNFQKPKTGFQLYNTLIYTNTKTPFSIEQDLILCNFFLQSNFKEHKNWE